MTDIYMYSQDQCEVTFYRTFEDSDIHRGVQCHEFIDQWKAGGIMQLSNAEQNLKLKEENAQKHFQISQP